MSELITVPSSMSVATVPAPLPEPRVAMRVRVATMEDIPFMDALQKKHGKQLGFFPRKQMEAYVTAGNVLIAEETAKDEGGGLKAESTSSFSPHPSSFLGYVAFRDRYLKRDELGVIYQLCVAPAGQRKLVGATLLKEVFARSPYGCRLYCCWCAQDIAANRFWEALGFVPLAFRAGSERKSRVHIFWQKRVREGDATPWWYPSETGGGAIKENRLVLPIPPGTHWSDAKPMVLPGEPSAKHLPAAGVSRAAKKKVIEEKRAPATTVALNRPKFAAPKQVEAAKPLNMPQPVKAKPVERVARRNDPMLVKKARELRDRWLEQVNASPAVAIGGKYDVCRAIEASGARDEAADGEVVEGEVVTKLLAA